MTGMLQSRETDTQGCRPLSAYAEILRGIAPFGIWAPYLWLGWTMSASSDPTRTVPWQTMYLAMALGLFALAIASHLVSRNVNRGSKLPENGARALPAMPRIADWACAVAMAVATAGASFLPSVMDPTSLSLLSAIIGGIAIAWMYMRWATLYAALELRSTVVYLFAGSATWACLQMLLELCPFTFQAIFVSLLPFFAIIMLHASENAPRTDGRGCGMRSQPPLDAKPLFDNMMGMWKAWAVIFAISSVTSLFIAASSDAVPHLDPLLFSVINCAIVGTLCVTVMLWACKSSLPFDFPLFWRVVMFVLAGGVMLVAVAPEGMFVSVFFRAVPGVLIPAVWLTVCDIANRCRAASLTVIGFGLGVYCLASFSGAAMSAFDAASLDQGVLGAILLFLLLLVSGLCLETRDPDIRTIFSRLRDNEVPVVEFASVDQRCSNLGSANGLTNREIEVMQMVCKGRSRTFIAEALFISENTVKAHVGHIYAKLDVHSRKELQQLIGL